MRDTNQLQPVIVEYGFLDNAVDANRIKENWEILTEAAVKGIMQYIGMPYTPPIAGKIIHIVRAGETLFSIANMYNTTVSDIKQLNNLTTNIISIGQQLLIPGANTEITPPSGNIVYIVQAGDSLWSIARKFDTTVEELRRINNLTNDILNIGQQIFVPGVSITPPGSETFTYTVIAGDSLWSIAQKFNTTVSELKQLNNLTSDILSIGQVLLIPRITTTEMYVYTVIAGDSLWSIAQRFNTTVEELRRINNLTSDILSIGQQIYIPSITIYTVVSGDSLWSIAQKFNTTVDELRKVNNLTSDILSIGQRLIIPV